MNRINVSSVGIGPVHPWKMKIRFGVAILAMQMVAMIATTVVAYALPDLTAVPGNANLQAPITIETVVKNIGLTTPSKNVKVKLELTFVQCGAGQIADQKKITKTKNIKKKNLEPGESVAIAFGPFLNGLLGTWLFAGFVVTVDPSNQIVEGGPGFENNNGYGILTFIQCAMEHDSLGIVPATERSMHTQAGQSPINLEVSQLRFFDAVGRKVLGVTGADQSVESLATQSRLANGVYLYVATLNDSQGKVSQKIGKVTVVRGRVSSVSSNEESTIPTSSAPPPLKRQRITCNGLKPTIIGTSGNDTIIGTEGKDVIAGLGGNDWIHGLGGDDIICGGYGNDLIVGGAGNDTILGGADHDTLDGSEGADKLYGNDGVDQIAGGPGNDYVRGGAGDDLLLGDEGGTPGNSGNDSLYGESGNDIVFGSSGNDLLNGGTGFDKLYGDSGVDNCIYGEQYTSCP